MHIRHMVDAEVGVHATTDVRSLPSRPELHCDTLTGWLRVVQLYAGHWDAVSVLATQLADEALVREIHFAALCGRPLVLNSFGSVVHVAGAPCMSGWAPLSGGPCVTFDDPASVGSGFMQCLLEGGMCVKC